MSHQNPLLKSVADGHVDVLLARLGLVLSIALIGLQFVASQPYLVVIPVSTGSACLLYLVTANHRPAGVQTPTLPQFTAGYLPPLVVGGLAAFVVVVELAGQRTWPAYLLAGGIGACILMQVLLVDEDHLDHRLVLAQIVVAAIVLRLAGLFATPGFVGVDIWTHVPVFVQGIVDAGSLSAIAESKYVMAPIYHSFAAISTLVFGSARPAVYLTLGLVIPISVLFLYGAGRLLLPMRWALLATALYAFADQFIQWGMHIIPTSVGLVFFLAIVYLVTRLFVMDGEWWVVALLYLFSLAVVFTHQVSTAILLVFLGLAAAVAVSGDVTGDGSRLGGLSRSAVALSLLFATTLVVTLVSWANTPHGGDGIFLWEMLSVAEVYAEDYAGFLNLASDPAAPVPGGTESQTLVETLVPFVELFGFALLLSTAVVGGLVMLRWDGSTRASLTYLVATAAFFVVVFGFSIFGFRIVLPGRWLAFLYVPMAVIAAVGLYYVSQTASRHTVLAVVLVLALAYPTTMVAAEKATLDSPAFGDQHPRFSFTESEQAAVETIETITPATATASLHTDHPYTKMFEKPVSRYESGILPMGENGAESDRPIVYRNYQSTGPVTWLVPDAATRTIYTESVAAESVCDPSRNVVYANDEVTLCLPNGGAGEGWA